HSDLLLRLAQCRTPKSPRLLQQFGGHAPAERALDRSKSRRPGCRSERIHGACSMIWFIIRRFLGLILTLWIVFTISFLLMHAVPGGRYSSERNLPPEIEENFKEKYRLNLPIYEQYVIQLGEITRGDLGLSQ